MSCTITLDNPTFSREAFSRNTQTNQRVPREEHKVEEVQGHPHHSFQYLKGSDKEDKGSLLMGHHMEKKTVDSSCNRRGLILIHEVNSLQHEQ